MSTALDTLLTPADGLAANDPRYQEIRGELDKLSSPTGTPVDWRTIARLGADLTREVGKDLNILAFLALARLQLHDLPGLVDALQTLRQIFLAPPPRLTPTKPTARAAAVDWLLTRLRAELPATPTTAAAAPQIHRLHDALRDLGVACREALGDLCPAFSTVLRLVDALRADLPGPTAIPPTDLGEPSLATPDLASTTAEHDAPPRTTQLAEPSTATPDLASTTNQHDAPPRPADPSSAEPDTPPAWRVALAPYLAPLPGADPSGQDPAGAEAFDDARSEILKLAALSAQRVDWAIVRARTDTLLRERSRDLRVAGWFALAGFHRDGLAGLTTGFHLVAAMLEEFDLFPRKPRARRDSSDWLIREAAAALASLPPEQLREPLLLALEAALRHLAAALERRLAPDVPSLRPLRDALQRALASVPTPREPAAALATPVPEDSQTRTIPVPEDSQITREPMTLAPPAMPLVTPTVTVAPADLTRLDHFLDTTGEALQSAARSLRELDPTDPRAYRLLRTGAWLGRSAPTPRADGTTAIPGLADRDRDQLVELHQHARWPGLLDLCEGLLARHCFALDLQRLATAALAGLGRDYAPAALAIRAELRTLLTCYPVLQELRTSDGHPLADPATQRWIREDVLPQGTVSTAADPPIDPTFWADLPARLAGGERTAALAEAQSRIDACPTGQLRFTARLALADACERANLVPLAALLLTGLTRELDHVALDQWDPRLAARCLTAAARCHRLRGADTEAHTALTHLARLDPTAALA